MKFKRFLSGISALAVAASAFAGMAVTANAATYANQAVDLSKFTGDGTHTYNSETEVESLALSNSNNATHWAKLDLTPYTKKTGEYTKSITITYKETVSSGGRSAIGFFDKDVAVYEKNAYQDVTGSYVVYGVMGSNTDKRVYVNGSGEKNNGKFTTNEEETVTLTFDMQNKTVSGSIGSHTISATAFSGKDSVDTFAVYSWSGMTYNISDMKISIETADTAVYTVAYDVNGIKTTEDVVENGKAEKIPETTRNGYIFKGWTKDSDTTLYTTAEIQAMAITADTTFTAQYEVNASYVEAISSVSIIGADSMIFGPDPDTAASNQYTVVITGADGTIITESNLSSNVKDFNVVWDIDGFATENDNPGQYCDSYGSFATNNAAQVATSFELRNVPMNFYGKMTATVTYNGNTYTATKYVVALGNKTVASNQILPEGGYPSDFDDYPSSLLEYSTKKDTYGTAIDSIVGGWVMSGSDGSGTAIIKSENGKKFIRITSATTSKSHMFTNSISSPATQAIFEQDVRFNSNGGVITLTSGYPFWSASRYTNPVTVSYNNSALTLNSTAITDNNDVQASVSAGTWYKLVLSIDKTTKTAFVKLYDANGGFVGGTDDVAWTEDSNPTYYSIGLGNSNTGTIDFDNYSAYYPTADTNTYSLEADKTTLSIPNKETAALAAALKTADGYDITGAATWTVLEDDMKEGVIITPDVSDSHKATVTLGNTAEAGTATVQVNIGGYTKTIELNITSSAESVKFTQSSASVSIPLNGTNTTATYTAIVVDGNGTDLKRAVTYGVYDKNNTSEYTLPSGITFANGVLTVTKNAPAVTFTIRATGKNSDNADISKSVKVTVHGLSFDFGTDADDALVEGYTAVTPDTSYTAARGYGIASGAAAAGGTASTSNAAADYLEGTMTFKADVEKGKNYTVEITYQGTLITGYVNSDLAGYTLGTQDSLAAARYTVAVPVDTLDLAVSGDGAKIAAITVTKNADKSARALPKIFAIGDSTIANHSENDRQYSWAYYLSNVYSTYSDFAALATFSNNGAGGRNLSSYYTQGKLAGVLGSIQPGDIVMLGDMGTNGLGSYFEYDFNYYLNAAEAMGAKVIINSYTPHGAVGTYTSVYNSTTHTFEGYRKDSGDPTVRKIAEERAANDSNYLGFVEIGKNADAAFNAYVADYAANGYESADAAAQAIINDFPDHNHYYKLPRDLMVNGYGDVKGIVAQLVDILTPEPKFSDIVEKATSGSTVTITEAVDGGNESATVANGAVVNIEANVTNATITSSGTFTVKKDSSVITNAKTVQFDDKGKMNPGDGAVISTPNEANNEATDKGFFITKSLDNAEETTFKINGKEFTAKLDGTKNGSVLFGIFVTGIPSGESVTITAE